MELHPKTIRELGRFNSCPHLYRRRGKQNIRRLSMDNELKDIIELLEDRYGSKTHWVVTNAEQKAPGHWSLQIIKDDNPKWEEKKEAADDNDK